MSPLSSWPKSKPNKKRVELATCFVLVFFFSYFSILKMEAMCSHEVSVGFRRTTWCYISEDRTLILRLAVSLGMLDVVKCYVKILYVFLLTVFHEVSYVQALYGLSKKKPPGL
jgi:hypothetical protein